MASLQKAAAAYICYVGMAILCLITAACTQAPQPGSETQSARPEQKLQTRSDSRAVSRDLTEDEREGGHVLERHVGRSDAELRERLERERHISAASTYTDRATAELAIGAAIHDNQNRIQRWLNRPGGHPNLVLDYHGDESVGRVLNRGESQSVPCSNAVVVLKWAGPDHYYVLTSYPECR